MISVSYSLLLASFLYILYNLLNKKHLSKKLPPGPPTLPIVGNLLQFSSNAPYIQMTNLAKTYGPLMSLKLGSTQAVVVSSPEMVKEVLMKHDQVCSSRPLSHYSEALNHREVSIVFLPVGRKWRVFRKLCKEHIFTVQKLQATESLRQEKLQQLRNYLHECSLSGRAIDVGETAMVTSLNLLSFTMFSTDFADYNSTTAQEMRKALQGIAETVSTVNPADFFPFLRWLDPRGMKRKITVCYEKILGLLDGIIANRLQSNQRKEDLLQVLLDLNRENDSELSLKDIKHFCMDLIFAGSSSTAEVTQWIMSEFLRDPSKMARAKDELRGIVGSVNKQLMESDIPKLSYIHAALKEIFRHRVISPLANPHMADADVEINGYTIPKGTTILVNVWAISRDEKIWQNADTYMPERFLNTDIDYKGQHFEYIPFSSGRRMCPALPFAHVMIHLLFAHFIHSFDWKLEGGLKPEELDMSETIGVNIIHRKTPLRAIPVKLL